MNGEDIALRNESGEMCYKDLNESIRKTAYILQESHVRQGDSVMLFLPNTTEFVIAFFATVYIGGIAVLVDVKMNEEIIRIVKENDIKLIFTDDSGTTRIKRIFENTKEESSLLTDIIIINRQSLLEFSAQERKVNIEPVEGSDNTAMILYTSGSTTYPKGVVNSHHTLIEAIDNYTSTLPITKYDKLLAVAPFFHSYAFGSCMLTGLYMGTTLVLKETFQPRQIIKSIMTERITIMHGVPYMYELIHQYFNPEIHCFGSIRYFISAGAPLSENTQKDFFNKTKCIIHQEYGSSETGTLCLNLSDDIELNIKSVGKPLNNVTIELYDQQNDIGIIRVKKTGCGIGYLSECPFNKEWYETEDIGTITQDGYVIILGRKSRVMNIAGLKVNPEEIEMCIMKYSKVRDVKIIPVCDSDNIPIIKALVVKNDESVTKEMIIDHCQSHLALYKTPSIIEWVSVIPKTSLGKQKRS